MTCDRLPQHPLFRFGTSRRALRSASNCSVVQYRAGSDHVSVLFTNDAFYAAFAGRDLQAMDELWSRRPNVTCIHPGWSPLIGRDSVMQSWRAILSNPVSPAIVCGNASAYVFADVAYVLCHESVEQAFLAATNVFVREEAGWKMVHHHAGPSPTPSFDPGAARQPLQ